MNYFLRLFSLYFWCTGAWLFNCVSLWPWSSNMSFMSFTISPPLYLLNFTLWSTWFSYQYYPVIKSSICYKVHVFFANCLVWNACQLFFCLLPSFINLMPNWGCKYGPCICNNNNNNYYYMNIIRTLWPPRKNVWMPLW